MKYMAEIELNSGMRNRLIDAPDIISATESAKRYINNSAQSFDKLQSNYERSKFDPFKPTGYFTVRPATPKEQIEDLLKDFAGNWNEYNISGLAEEIIDIVLENGEDDN